VCKIHFSNLQPTPTTTHRLHKKPCKEEEGGNKRDFGKLGK